MKLTLEQKADLRELTQLESFSLIEVALAELVQDQERSVLKCISDDEKNLVRLKCRAEGAAKLLSDFKTRMAQLKARKES